ncbi:MAG TPA: hypothetical protein VGL94_02655, partial [Ktedonobacteraceae bacterium]
FVHQPTWPKRLLYTIQAIICSFTLTIGSFAFLWAGPHTFDRFLAQIQQQLFSFDIFLNAFSSWKISFYEANLIGLVLFGICFCYALRLSSRNFSSLLKACWITMFALLALSVTTVEPWYLIWPFMLAILVPQIEVSLAAILLAYAGTLAGIVHQYIDPGEQLPSNLYLIQSVVYLTFFPLPMLLLIVLGLWHIFLRLLPLRNQIKRGSITTEK